MLVLAHQMAIGIGVTGRSWIWSGVACFKHMPSFPGKIAVHRKGDPWFMSCADGFDCRREFAKKTALKRVTHVLQAILHVAPRCAPGACTAWLDRAVLHVRRLCVSTGDGPPDLVTRPGLQLPRSPPSRTSWPLSPHTSLQEPGAPPEPAAWVLAHVGVCKRRVCVS